MSEKKPTEVREIDMALVKAEALDRAFETLRAKGLTQTDTTKMTLPQKVAAMQAYTKKVIKQHGVPRKANCEDCKQDSDTALAACPYCGAADEEQSETASKTAIVPAAASPVVAPLTLVFDHAEVVGKLDGLVHDIRRLQSDVQAGVWEMADKLADIERDQLWKNRRKPDGTVAYRTREAFAQAELGMSRQYVKTLLDIRERYNAEQFRTFGPTKLALMMRLGPADEKQVLDAAKSGHAPSKREIARKLGHNADAAKREKTPAPPATPPTPLVSKTPITVAVVEGKKIVDLHVMPASRGTPIEKCPRAKKLQEHPWGYIELANDVRQWFRITRSKTSGDLQLVIDTKRLAE